MKRLRPLLLVAVAMFVIAVPVFAMERFSVNYSEVEYASGGSTILCSDYFGCPACQSNMTETQAVCVKVRFANGFCQCGSPQSMTPGGGRPICLVLRGSCKFIW